VFEHGELGSWPRMLLFQISLIARLTITIALAKLTIIIRFPLPRLFPSRWFGLLSASHGQEKTRCLVQ